MDAIFDTSVGTDLTIMEESEELLEALEEKGREYPLFTSCCPGWIRFVETQYPHLMKYVSTSKSPMEMFGAVIKEYYKKQDKKRGKKRYLWQLCHARQRNSKLPGKNLSGKGSRTWITS